MGEDTKQIGYIAIYGKKASAGTLPLIKSWKFEHDPTYAFGEDDDNTPGKPPGKSSLDE